MAVRIRLKKMGRKHRPFFRLCAMDSRSPRDGRVIEELGTYDPMVPETDARAILKGERIDYWLSVGAKPTPKVGVLIRKYGTDGSHLAQQTEAIERLGGRRAASIDAAKAAAAAAPKPKLEPDPEETAEEATDETAAAANDEAAAEAPAAETPAAEAPAAETPAEEAPAAETPAEEAPAAEAPAEEAPAAEAPAEEAPAAEAPAKEEKSESSE